MTDPRHLTPADEPPYDPDYDSPLHRIEADAQLAEKHLLAALLTRPNEAPQLLCHLDPQDFHNPTYETIWATAQTLLDQGTTPDQLALQQHLAHNQTFTRFGGFNLLLDLRDTEAGDIAAADPERYARTIRDAARWRHATSLTTAAQAALRTADPTTIEKALQTAAELTEQAAVRFGPRTLTDADTGLKDLSWIRDGKPPAVPLPTYVTRTDGTALFYPGKVNGLFGDPESGKTWLAQIAMVEAFHQGGTAAMIDVDHNGMDHTAARLLLLGARPEHLWDPDTFRYYEPEDGQQLRNAVRQVTGLAPNVVLLDSLGEVLPMMNVASKDNDEITAALRAVVQPPADAGSCVITIDHLPKSTEARSTGFAIGGTAKKRAIRGAYIRVDSKVKPAPGGIGRAVLRIEKDTLGGLRKTSAGGYAGELTLDSTTDGITRWDITRDTAPLDNEGGFRPSAIMEQVSRYVEDNDQATGREIKAGVKAKGSTVDRAIEILVAEGYMTKDPGARRSWIHHVTIAYREEEDQKRHTTTPDTPPEPDLWSTP